jgi:hypothetical protein
MTTTKTATTSPKPLLSIAAFCTQVLEGADGLMSGIRFLEYITVPVAANRDPEKREPVSLWALIAFKSDRFEGEYVLRLVLRTPTRRRIPLGEQRLTPETPATSLNFRIKVDLKLKTQGTFWVDVFLNGKRYTRMPLRVFFFVVEDSAKPADQPASS